MFKSKELIVLSETPIFKLRLINDESQSNEQTIFNGLPSPNTSSFFINQEEGVMSSPMYIYI